MKTKRTKEQRRSERRAFYLRHRERLLREMKEYRDNKRDKEKVTAYQRSYYFANKERLNAINRAYYHKHKTRLNSNNSARRRAGIIKTNMVRKRDWTRQRRKLPDYRVRERLYCRRDYVKIKRNLSRRIKRALLGGRKSANTLQLLGCSIDQLKQFLESQFTDGMNWGNYGVYWHIDHHIPCAAHDLSKPEGQKRCFHWRNLRALKTEDNLKKNDRHPRTGIRASIMRRSVGPKRRHQSLPLGEFIHQNSREIAS
jgi:hypothetical protein